MRYPKIKVQLSGKDGNAFVILALMRKGLRKGRVSEAKIEQFVKEAKGGNYDHLLQTCMKWVDVT